MSLDCCYLYSNKHVSLQFHITLVNMLPGSYTPISRLREQGIQTK
jgi:hypothetical protein